MSSTLQSGIYYSNNPEIGNSFGTLFLKVEQNANALEVGDSLSGLWKVYEDLKQGIENDLRDVDLKHRHPDNLTILIAFGPGIFRLPGIKQKKPTDLNNQWLFLNPLQSGGGVVLANSGLKYSNDITANESQLADIAVQFISTSQVAANRPIVETWKYLKNRKDRIGKETLTLSHFYTGFQRLDRRGWLGFHEGVSNINPEERLDAIVINNTTISNPHDIWTVGGTYLAFLRMIIDLETWRKTSLRDQQIIVGRHKLTGCPLIGIDQMGNPLKDSRCPVPGTSEVIENGNEIFREHPHYRSQDYDHLDITDEILSQSHVGRARHINEIPSVRPESFRIFRQGFEFLESADVPPYFRVGLNFISFQNSTQRIVKILTSDYWLGGTNFGGYSNKPISGMINLISVRSAGMFIVPPRAKNNLFPGNSLFF